VKRFARGGGFVAVLLCVVSSLPAQLAEVQLGVVASYGSGDPFKPGGGLVLGIAPGRLTYAGLRWTYYPGATRQGVRNRAQVFALDLGVQLPVGPLEVVPGLSLGFVRFAQRTSTVSGHATEFLAAPGVSVETHLASLAFIPELQYDLAGNPDLSVPVRHRGLVASLRIVIPIEVGRLRH